MENQHRMITGYRELSQAEIDLMNRIKAHGEASRALLEAVDAHLAAQYNATQPPRDVAYPTSAVPRSPEAQAEFDRLCASEPRRWRALACTHFQEGLMALTRAVAQPASF